MHVPTGEISELAESMRFLGLVNEQLPELRTRCQAERPTFWAAQMDLRENEWRFVSRSVGELLCGLWDRHYRKEVVAQSFIVWGVG
jgi:hypothetical protein